MPANWAITFMNFKRVKIGSWSAQTACVATFGRRETLKNWRDSNVTALLALADGRAGEAARNWLQAAQLIDASPPDEPLSAMAQNNAGVALLLNAEPEHAADCFTRAAHFWDRTRVRIEASEPELASSSVFHLRLAMKHQNTFTALRRARYLDLCEAGRRIAEFNAGIATTPRPDECRAASADQSMIAALSSAFGPNCIEIRILRGSTDDGLAAYRDKAARLAEWNAHSYVDAGQYLANVELAAHMSALLHLGVLSLAAR